MNFEAAHTAYLPRKTDKNMLINIWAWETIFEPFPGLVVGEWPHPCSEIKELHRISVLSQIFIIKQHQFRNILRWEKYLFSKCQNLCCKGVLNCFILLERNSTFMDCLLSKELMPMAQKQLFLLHTLACINCNNECFKFCFNNSHLFIKVNSDKSTKS